MGRLRFMKREVELLVQRVNAEVAVIEMPSGKMHRSIRGRASGQTIYGAAAGVVLSVLWDRFGYQSVKTVADNEWTGSAKKKDRAKYLPLDFPQYDPQADSGLDMADAIELGRWWCNEQILAGAR